MCCTIRMTVSVHEPRATRPEFWCSRARALCRRMAPNANRFTHFLNARFSRIEHGSCMCDLLRTLQGHTIASFRNANVITAIIFLTKQAYRHSTIHAAHPGRTCKVNIHSATTSHQEVHELDPDPAGKTRRLHSRDRKTFYIWRPAYDGAHFLLHSWARCVVGIAGEDPDIRYVLPDAHVRIHADKGHNQVDG